MHTSCKGINYKYKSFSPTTIIFSCRHRNEVVNIKLTEFRDRFATG